MDDKYVVFKADVWHPWNEARLNGDPPPTALVSLNDAIVIRKQDIFAGPGLYAYANAIQTAIDLIKLMPESDSKHLAQWEPLEELRDFFVTQAQEAVEWPNKKIPD